MIGFGESVYPLDDLFEVRGSTVDELYFVDVQRSRQCEQFLGRAAPCGCLLAWDHLCSIASKQGLPAGAFLMRQPVDFLGVERRKTACHALTPQVILFRMLLDVRRYGIISALDAEFLVAGLVDQFPRVPDADGEKLHKTDRIGLLPGIIPFLRSPFNEAGPARQRGQL